jgi:hypothetical protein
VLECGAKCVKSPRFKAVENCVGHVSVLFYGCLENAISGSLFMFVDVTAVFQDMKMSDVLVSLLVTIKNELLYYYFCDLRSKKECKKLEWVVCSLIVLCLNCLTKELQAL